jgi:hypothetical protein
MTDLDYFQHLKEKVLLKYQEQYPFFQGNWKSFSAQDIQNLIGLIEVQCKQSISEKWIYTHLKPESNSKVPRKDMLNILSEFVGYSGWDEFIFEDKTPAVATKLPSETKSYKKGIVLFGLIVVVGITGFIVYNQTKKTGSQTIQLHNEFTDEKVNSEEVKVFQVEDSISKELEVKEGKVEVSSTSGKGSQLIIKSPYYKSKTISIIPNASPSEPIQRVALKPDDYAMMIKAFMVSDIKDWQTRKEQLNQILSDNLEVIVMLKDDLGAEFFNKKEFSQLLVVPSESVKKMKIVEIKNDGANKIQFLRIKQE